MKQFKTKNGATVAMVRAFVSLSESLSLTKTCQDIGATRQTVRRHITDLEEIVGKKLFLVVDRKYQLTSDGHAALEGAKSILRQLDIWSGAANLKTSSFDGLQRDEYTDQGGRKFYSQQHPVSKLTTKGLPLLKHALKAWGASAAAIEHEAMNEVRPYIVLFRKGQAGWVFVDIGQDSAYANWFGWTWSKSAIGKLLDEDKVGDDYNDFISGAYARIYNEGGVRFDHIYAHLPQADKDPVPVTFQRLLMGCSFPDGTPGLILIAAGTNKVQIDALDASELPQIPSDQIMDDVLS